VPTLSLADNLLLGSEPRGRFGISRRRVELEARDALRPLCGEVDAGRLAGDCSTALRQLTCIARALRLDARLLILDEATSSLDPHEVERVFAAVRAAAARGVAVVFVSHFLDQVYELCDRATVLRDGSRVATAELASLPRAGLIELMLGSVPATAAAEREAGPGGATLLEARGVGRRSAIAPFDLDVRAGEVVGLAGLLGSGRTELVRTLFGAEALDSGTMSWRGRPASVASPRDAVRLGIAFCPEDRAARACSRACRCARTCVCSRSCAAASGSREGRRACSRDASSPSSASGRTTSSSRSPRSRAATSRRSCSRAGSPWPHRC
jgi:simple sugar transport system ATP-binding protein